MVATSQTAAVEAGLALLAAGGNAADAAVATAAALAVTEPSSCGLGGDCFALYYSARSREVSALNGSGRAPLALSIERLAGAGITALDPFSPHTVTVPGAVRAWIDLVERLGRKSIAEVLAPAIALADDGFEVGPITSHFWRLGAMAQLARWPHGGELTIDGRGPEPGERFNNPHVAQVLAEIAEAGAGAFYRGRVAAAIVAAVRDAGGALALDDLAAHRSDWPEPISADLDGVRIWEHPPNGQGLVALLALGALRAKGPIGAAGDPLRWHRLIEALRLGFADGLHYIADPDAAPAPVDALLSEGYAATRAARIDDDAATADVDRGSPLAASETAYLSVVDGDGDACSLIVSNYMGFGTGIVPEGCGFSLQNRGHNFSLDPTHANALAPGKRPLHTIIPGMATSASDGSLAACFGVMGGFMQPQGHAQVALGLFCDGADPQTVLDRPRLRVDPFAAGASKVSLEAGFDRHVAAELERRGHAIRWLDGWQRSAFGRGQIVAPDGAGGLIGGSDPRADGCARAVEKI
jgi:gamma-glutamyltranspeptidase/glutathione hydrolase